MAQNNYLELNDQEIILKIKEDAEALGIVYKKCKSSALQFLRKINYHSNERIDIEDIFHDAIIVLHEKISSSDFILTSSLQTYLNSVCRFQLLKKIEKNNAVEFNDNNENDDNESEDSMRFNSLITDTLEEFEDSIEHQYNAIENALEKMKAAGGHCYELLTLFWYHKKSMNELAEIFGYTNAANTKNQKARCQKRLEKITFDLMNN
jgi:RNA polymerase sigma factor (sigma-70 family)